MITEEALKRSRATILGELTAARERRDRALLQIEEAKSARRSANADIDEWRHSLGILDAMETMLFGPVREAAE